jgi:oligopeptide transport system substrate-binding protein
VLRSTGGTIDRNNPWARPGTLISNGPFVVKEWIPDQLIRTERNPHFREAAAVALNGVTFHPYTNAATQENAFRTGQLHLTASVPLTKIAAYQAENPAALRLDPFLQTAFIRFNTTRPPFDDARVRQALALAIDRAALSAQVLTGGEEPAASLTPPGTEGFTPAHAPAHDPDQARALLADAGYPDGAGFPAVEIQTRPREIDLLVLEAIQQMWRRELGVQINIARKEQRVWLNDEKTLNYDLSNAAWIGDYVSPDTFLSLFTSGSGYNATGWGDESYDTAVEQARRTSDQKQRLAAYAAAEQRLREATPITPLYHGTQPFLIRPEVVGWPPALLGFHRYQNVRLETGAVTVETP